LRARRGRLRSARDQVESRHDDDREPAGTLGWALAAIVIVAALFLIA